jgi:hypothetical protein
MTAVKLQEWSCRQTDIESMAHAMKRLSILLGILLSLALATGLCAAQAAGGDLATPVISEFMASNGSQTPLVAGDLLDADGDSSDWIELYNPTAGTFDLGGWYLTDDAQEPAKWRFPSPTVLAPDGFLVVFASGKNRTTGELTRASSSRPTADIWPW